MHITPKGAMRQQYIVICACGTTLAVPTTRANRRQAAGFARGQGWHLTQKLGWICPACAERLAKINHHGATRKGVNHG